MNKQDLCLVTGAAGFIGSHLTDELVKRGFKVRVLVKPGEPVKNIAGLIKQGTVEVVEGNLLDKAALKRACRGVALIFHLAAKSDFSFVSYKPYYEINFIGTKNLVECAGKGLKRFVYYSTILASGLPGTRKPVDESFAGQPNNFYGESKRAAEDYLIGLYREKKFPVTIIRPTTVYGPREVAVQYFLFKTIQDGKFVMIGNGKNLMSYVFVKNLVDATIDAASSAKALGQAYYINDKRPYSFGEVVRSVYEVMGKKPGGWHIPFILALLGAAAYKLACDLLRMKPMIYPSRVKTMVLNYVYSVKKAEKDFAYQPKYNLEQGVKETYLWYKSEGYLK